MTSRNIYRNLSLRTLLKPRLEEQTAEPLTEEQKKMLRSVITGIGKEKPLLKPSSTTSDATVQMDSIRARGFLKYRYNYTPPTDISDRIKNVAGKIGLALDSEFQDLNQKFKLLTELGNELKHFIPNSRLHKIKAISDVVGFYSEPVKNITTYTELARDDKLPQNIAIREHPLRFHPNDKHSFHGGITAFPGDGGEVLSIRNKRLLRQFQPKKNWFEYEDQSFDYEPLDKDMPWDPEVARKMDRYSTKTFFAKKLKN